MDDPLVVVLVAVAAGIIVLVLAVRVWHRWRWSAYLSRRRRELRKRQRAIDARQEEIERLAGRIVSTSSTTTIAGFEIVRQIEAVFADGYPSQSRAVEALKAQAAEKGANALINLGSARLPSGKCVAQGDAVVVRPVAGQRNGSPAEGSDETGKAAPADDGRHGS
jgi:uncharacterized protein YbjQ (UPF0145 family)